MHEVSLMQDLLSTAIEQVEQRGLHQINRLKVRIGTVSGVDRECIEQAYSVLTAGTPAAGAALEVETVPAVAICAACLRRFEPEIRGDLCPRCGTVVYNLVQGDEFDLQVLEVE